MPDRTFAVRQPGAPRRGDRRVPGRHAAAVDAAVDARPPARSAAWSTVPVPARAEIVAACGQVLAQRKDDLARLVAAKRARCSSRRAATCRKRSTWPAYIAGQGRNAWGETHPCEMPDKIGFTTRHPVGVVGMITPWNFPVAIPSWKIFPALLAGNGVVIKPSEHAPACCEAFVDACRDAGVPDGLVEIVHGFGEAGGALVEHPGVRAISFTGSVPTGRRVAAAAMEHGPEARVARARRQERDGRDARRRPRARHRGRAVRRVRHVGPALHVDVAARRAPRRRRRTRRRDRGRAPRSSCSATRATRPPTSAR